MADGDSTQILDEPLALETAAVQSFSFSKDLPPPTQTLDPQTEVDDYLIAPSFDEIAQQYQYSESSESQHENKMKPLITTEALQGADEPVLSSSPSAAEATAFSETFSPLVVDDAADNVADETDAWISCNSIQADALKPSSSSSWNEDANEKPSLVGAGLANLGNTCFFNAVLQCFTHLVLLVQGLYAYNHPTPCDCHSERFCLICSLREHIEYSLSSTGKILFPQKFVDNLSYFSSSFQRFQQEDAHEFLQCFLDKLESSLSKLKAMDAASSSENLVKQVFGGCVVSKLRCCNCNHISDTYEPSVDLSLEIDDADSLASALKSFTKVEHIEDEEMKFTCDQCKEKVSVEKQLMLDQTPPVYAFHLKRFKNYGSYVEKIDKHVEFPLELDLQPYASVNQSNNVDLQYKLYAVVVHAAFTSSCGHYYCYIRSAPDTWYKFDDSKVTRVSEACVLSEEAYILFYARQDTPWFSNFMETYKPSFFPNLSNNSPKSVLENVDSVAGAKDHPSESDAVVPLRPVHHSELNTSDHVVNEKVPLNLKEYGSNHMREAYKRPRNSHNRFHAAGENSDRVFSQRNLKPNDLSGDKTCEMELVYPSTPPRSPGLDSSDDDISDLVFAPRADQLKLVEKAPTHKRPRDNETEESAKREALKQCKRMPGSRGRLLMAALETNKKSKSPPRKKARFNRHHPRRHQVFGN